MEVSYCAPGPINWTRVSTNKVSSYHTAGWSGNVVFFRRDSRPSGGGVGGFCKGGKSFQIFENRANIRRGGTLGIDNIDRSSNAADSENSGQKACEENLSMHLNERGFEDRNRLRERMLKRLLYSQGS